MPITRLDGMVVGDGAPVSMFKRLYQLYQTYKNTVMRGDTNNN
jgi:D-alanine transaminase